jgi:hypothetical protein
MYDMPNSVAANRGTHNGNRKSQKILQPVWAVHFQYQSCGRGARRSLESRFETPHFDPSNTHSALKRSTLKTH